MATKQIEKPVTSWEREKGRISRKCAVRRGKASPWAVLFIEQVVNTYNDESRWLGDPEKPMPDVYWQWRFSRNSSGKTVWPGDYQAGIHLRIGGSRQDAKLIILHELAHWLTGECHTERFWREAFTLYRRYRLPVRYFTMREFNYKKLARKVYAKHWAWSYRRLDV